MTDRELDALVAENVMGWKKDGKGWWVTSEYKTPDGWDWKSRSITPNFTESISWAWQVVEKMLPFYHFGLTEAGEGFFVCSFDEKTPKGYKANGMTDAKTAPRAICLAALKAVGVEVPN